MTRPRLSRDSNSPHVPVLLEEVLTALDLRDGASYVDGTFGAGGYTLAMLNRAGCTVYAIDRDPNAAAAGRALPEAQSGRLVLMEGRFGDMDQLLAERGVNLVDGVALDIGVSSMQIDQAERGFSFAKDGPLDMRMEQSGPSAADVVNYADEEDIANILYRLGEERQSRRIARAIVAARADKPFERTLELAGLVAKTIRKSSDGIHPATRTFQALRIHVNDELGELERGLAAAEKMLAPGGRLAVVTFHSLEDRVVKTFLKERSGDVPSPSRHLPQLHTGPAASFTLVGRKAITAGAEEVSHNPRSRSAKLRVAVRTHAPAWGNGR